MSHNYLNKSRTQELINTIRGHLSDIATVLSNLASGDARDDTKAPIDHTQASNTITAMTGYTKPQSTSAIAATDTLNEAIGKLEKGLEDAGGGSDNLFSYSGQSHASVFRGKYLGSSFTSAQKAAIADGSFDDLYVGDYWTIGEVNWRIADIDYYYDVGSSTEGLGYFKKHHLVIIPDTALQTSKYHSSSLNGVGYKSAYINITTLGSNGTIAQMINNAFGASFISPHYEYLATGAGSSGPGDGKWNEVTLCLLCGSMIWTTNLAIENDYNTGCNANQLAVFKLCPALKYTSDNLSPRYWLRDIYSKSYAYCFDTQPSDFCNNSRTDSPTSVLGVRPYFCLVGA